MSAVAVREFVPGDEPAITALIDAALRHDRPPGITLQDLQHGVDRMAGDPSETLVATVVPAWRGRGLGRELLRWAIAWNRAAGAGTIELNVEAENDRALALYRSTGFSQEVEWPKYALATGA